jgi:hypothetical protein
MTLCPVAIAVGCRKCPLFSVCPAKGVIGDYREETKDQGSRDRAAAEPDPKEKR